MIDNDFLNALGLGNIVTNKRKLNHALRLASFEPDFKYEMPKDRKGRVFFTRYKLLGRGFGCWVAGYRRNKRPRKDAPPAEKYVVIDWGVFANGAADSAIGDVYIDMDDDNAAYCFASDEASGNFLEFRLNNEMEIISMFRRAKSDPEAEQMEENITGANFAMLMIFATIILPVDSEMRRASEIDPTQISDDFAPDYDERELRKRARAGDIEAETELAAKMVHYQSELRERLLNEDMLTVLDNYFLNLAEQSGVFSILADIEHLEEITNELTDEKLYRLDCRISGTKMSTYVNQKDIVGEPSPGMRLMGIGLAQGFILIP